MRQAKKKAKYGPCAGGKKIAKWSHVKAKLLYDTDLYDMILKCTGMFSRVIC